MPWPVSVPRSPRRVRRGRRQGERNRTSTPCNTRPAHVNRSGIYEVVLGRGQHADETYLAGTVGCAITGPSRSQARILRTGRRPRRCGSGRSAFRQQGSTVRRAVPLRTCRPAVPPTLHQAPPSRHREKYRREPLARARLPARWPLSSGGRTTWRPCSTSGCRCTPDRHPGPEGLAEARCRTRSTRLPPAAGAGCAA